MSGTVIRELEPLSAFAGVARALTESLELEEVLRRIASTMLELTRSLGVSVVLPRGEWAEFVAHESPPPHSRLPVGYRFRRVPDLEAQLARGRDPLVILGLHASPLIPEDIKAQIEAQDLILVPLGVDDDLVGALVIAFRELPERWPWDPALLRAIGDQAAVAIRNAQLYEEARTATERLLQAEKLSALGRVVARVAHQLNNPLTTARLTAESLAMERLEPAARDQVRALGGAVERAALVVHDLLIFARHGRRPFGPVDVSAVVRDVVDERERRLAAAGVGLTIDVADGVPHVHGDALALRQLLANLLTNAEHALSGRDGDRRILVRVRRLEGADGRSLAIDVEDSGPGIAAGDRARIFEPFYTTKPLGEGTGLGLAIAREIAEVHGGTIDVGTASLGGAAFRLRLPVPEPASGRAEPAAAPARASHPGDRVGDGMRVLIIDDEAELQRALTRVLERMGCSVDSELSGEDGLRRALDGEYDVILCDVRVPRISGRELFHRLREENASASARLAFMTGDSLSEEVRSFLASTGRPVLAKPFGRADLEALLVATRGEDT